MNALKTGSFFRASIKYLDEIVLNADWIQKQNQYKIRQLPQIPQDYIFYLIIMQLEGGGAEKLIKNFFQRHVVSNHFVRFCDESI